MEFNFLSEAQSLRKGKIPLPGSHQQLQRCYLCPYRKGALWDSTSHLLSGDPTEGTFQAFLRTSSHPSKSSESSFPKKSEVLGQSQMMLHASKQSGKHFLLF